MQLYQLVLLLGILVNGVNGQHESDWMSLLGNGTKLTEINIPGTHDSMAVNGGFWTKCQTKKLSEQYDMGVRFVDIRVRHDGDTLPIYHGAKFEGVYFGEYVVTPTVEWLKKHPGETILMLVQMDDFKTTAGKLQFNQLVRNALNASRAQYLEHMPTDIGKARGNIIIINKNWPGNETKIGVPIEYLDVFDNWTISDKGNKWNAVKRNLDCVISASMDKMMMTYASGYTTFLDIPDPKAMADYVNPRLAQYGTAHKKQRMGIILVDFVEMENNMATHIIRWRWRILTGRSRCSLMALWSIWQCKTDIHVLVHIPVYPMPGANFDSDWVTAV